MSNVLSPQQIQGVLSEFQKAYATTAFPNADLNRQDLQAEMVVVAPIDTPLRNRLHRSQGNGNAHAFYRLKPNTDKSKGIFLGTVPGNSVFTKGGLPTDSNESYELVSVPYYNLGDVVQVPFQDQAQGRSYVDLLAQRTKVKMINVGLMEEYFIINGDSTVLQSGGGYIFDGLKRIIPNQGGVVNPSPDGKITLGLLRQTIESQWENGGYAKMAVMSGLAKSIITAQVNQFYGIRQTDREAMSNANFGVSVNAFDLGYGPVDFIVSRYITPDPSSGAQFVLTLDDATLDPKNDGNVIDMIDVDPLNSVDLAIVGTAFRKVIYETTALRVSAPSFQGITTGLTFTGQSPVTG